MIKQQVSSSASSLIVVTHDFQVSGVIEDAIKSGVELAYGSTQKSVAAMKNIALLHPCDYVRDAARTYAIVSALNAMQSSSRPELANFLASNWISADRIAVWHRILQSYKLPNAVCEVFRQVYSPIQLNDGTLVVILPKDDKGRPDFGQTALPVFQSDYYAIASLYAGSLVPATRSESLDVLAMINTSRFRDLRPSQFRVGLSSNTGSKISSELSETQIKIKATSMKTKFIAYMEKKFTEQIIKDIRKHEGDLSYEFKIGKVHHTLGDLIKKSELPMFNMYADYLLGKLGTGDDAYRELSEWITQHYMDEITREQIANNDIDESENREDVVKTSITPKMRDSNAWYEVVYYPSSCVEAAEAGMIDGLISVSDDVMMLDNPSRSLEMGAFTPVQLSQLLGGGGGKLPYLISKQVDVYLPVQLDLEYQLYADWWRKAFTDPASNPLKR